MWWLRLMIWYLKFETLYQANMQISSKSSIPWRWHIVSSWETQMSFLEERFPLWSSYASYVCFWVVLVNAFFTQCHGFLPLFHSRKNHCALIDPFFMLSHVSWESQQRLQLKENVRSRDKELENISSGLARLMPEFLSSHAFSLDKRFGVKKLCWRVLICAFDPLRNKNIHIFW